MPREYPTIDEPPKIPPKPSNEEIDWKRLLRNDIITVILKFIIIILVFFIYNMLVNKMSFYQAVDWLGKALADTTQGYGYLILFCLGCLGLYTISTLILDTMRNPYIIRAEMVTEDSYAQFGTRQPILKILGKCLFIIVTIWIGWFLTDQILYPPFGIYGQDVGVLIALFWVLFFFVRDIYRIVKDIIFYNKYQKPQNSDSNQLSDKQ